MQSIAVVRSLRLLPATRTCLLPLARASTSTAGPADTAVHSQDPQGDDAEEAPKAAAAAEERERRERQQDIKTPPTIDNIPPFAPSPKLESHEVGRPGDPSFQQKRRWSHAAAPGCVLIEDATCVGVDGSPLAGGFEAQVKEEEEEYAAYYKEHKPSPLSEIEFVDTRKPISQAWDGGASDDVGMGVMVEDTVDAALQRAEAMFQAARERGTPTRRSPGLWRGCFARERVGV
ncbi:uncharacterized protein [Elaeis guineensis]|uniref:uncharacterized protein n=1 Tax=Elaeis guineensis var. tenera TaxID=51953 RepID=UPI003C6D36A8